MSSQKKNKHRSFSDFAITGYKGPVEQRTFYAWASRGLDKIGSGMFSQDGNIIPCKHPEASSMVKVLDFSGCDDESEEAQARYLAVLKKKHTDGRKNVCSKQRCVKFCRQILDRYYYVFF